MDVVRFTDGGTSYETWELPDAGWEDCAAKVDHFLAQAIQDIAAEYADDRVEWLEINYWQNSGRLIVFPSKDGPHGDRGERVCLELSSEFLANQSRWVSESVQESEQDGVWEAFASRVWHRVGESLLGGEAAHQLDIARKFHKMRVAGYDYSPGEAPLRLVESGALA